MSLPARFAVSPSLVRTTFDGWLTTELWEHIYQATYLNGPTGLSDRSIQLCQLTNSASRRRASIEADLYGRTTKLLSATRGPLLDRPSQRGKARHALATARDLVAAHGIDDQDQADPS